MEQLLRWFAFVTSLAAVIVLLFLPAYSGVTVQQSIGGPAIQSTRSATLVEVNGFGVLLVLSIPVLAAISALVPWPARYRRRLDVLAAVVTIAFSVLGAFTVGLFFLPMAIALLVVALWPRKSPTAS